MNTAPRWILILLALAILASPLAAQSGGTEEKPLDPGQLREQRARAAENSDLGTELQGQVLALYDEALSSLAAAADSEREIAGHAREKAGIGPTIEALRSRLARPEPLPRSPLGADATAEQALNVLAQERSRLSADLARLRSLERNSEEQAAYRNDIAKRLGTLDQELESLSIEILAATQGDLPPALKTATQTSIQARRERGLRRVEALRSELSLLDARAALTPWQIDQAQRRISYGEQIVALLEAATSDLRRREAARSLERVRAMSTEASEKAVALQQIAAETRDLAELLWGPHGVQVRSAEAASKLTATKKHQTDLDRIVQISRRKFEAFGHRGSITRWWPDVPDDFPLPGAVSGVVRDLKRRIPEAQHRLIQFEQQRTDARKLAFSTQEGLNEEVGEEAAAELHPLMRNLLNERRDLLEELIQAYGTYINRLVEQETATHRFLDEVTNVQEFLYSSLLWVRSVPRPLIPRAADLGAGAGWFLSASSWEGFFGAIRAAIGSTPGKGIGLLLLFGLLLGLRRPMGRRMKQLAEQASTPATDSYRTTLGALLYTVLLAAPLPLALYMLGRALQSGDVSPFLFAAGRALPFVAWILALLELIRQTLAPAGLAEAHFGWPSELTRFIHRGLLWPEIAFIPLGFVSMQIAMSGMQLQSPEQLQTYNNSFGRVVFIVGMVALGLALLGLFRPRKHVEKPRLKLANAWLHRLYMYVYPAVLLGTFVPALLATLGYYITGFLLAYQVLRMVWLAVALLLLSGMLLRWRETRALDLRAEEDGESDAVELPEAEKQVRQLFRAAIILLAVVGLYNIWSAAAPTLQIMKRVQVWPSVAMLELSEEEALALVGSSDPKTETTEAESSDPTASAPPVKVPGMRPPAVESATPDEAAQRAAASLTLWEIGEALLAILITVLLVKNIPGLLEMILSRRTHLDTGARIALGTLIRYAIIIFGVSAAFGFLGISWSKIQWLAAALTFGIGFGLQEIVANFVSGLILLMERPVRVGDAVTVGNLQGRVSKHPHPRHDDHALGPERDGRAQQGVHHHQAGQLDALRFQAPPGDPGSRGLWHGPEGGQGDPRRVGAEKPAGLPRSRPGGAAAGLRRRRDQLRATLLHRLRQRPAGPGRTAHGDRPRLPGARHRVRIAPAEPAPAAAQREQGLTGAVTPQRR